MPSIFRLSFLLLFLSFTLISSAQQQSILIKVVDAKYNPVGFANISIVNKIDSTKITNTVTDSIGISKINLAAKANLAVKNAYTIKVSAIGYKKYSKDYYINDQSSIAIKLTEDPTQLNEVVVKSTKALIRQEDDKSVVDPEALAASSTNAYETVEKVPGVFIDQDGNIYLNGLSPAGVQINGRDLKMSAADIAILLKSLPPNAIQKIELIRTPSAKYDASGGGGLVNIILMKGVKIGINGSVNTGFTQGEYGNQYIGFNLNNNNDKLSSYVNAQYNNGNDYSITNTDRILSIDSVLRQEARAVKPNHSVNLGYGFGKTIKEKWELNYDGRMSQNKFDNTTNNLSFLRQLSTNQNTGNLQSYVNNKGTNNFMNQSFRVKLKLDTVGGEWVNDVSFNFSKSSTDQNYSNLLLAKNTSTGGEGDYGNDRNYFTYQSDIRKKLRGINIESGVKTSVLNFNNNSNYTKNVAGLISPDPFRTSKFHYTEQINAAYLQGSKTWGPIVLKVGSRLEQTIMQGHQFIPKDTTFSVNRTDAFPYVYLSRKIMMIMNYELRGFLVYRKTISRPSYDYLNPFAKYIDPFLYEVGNPNLKPQFTSNYEANISVDDKPLFAYGVNETNDIFTNVVYQSPTNKQVSYRTYDNLGKSRETYFRIIGVIPPGKKFFAVLGTQYNRNNYNGFYEGKPIMFNRGTWSVFTFQSFKLDGLSTMTLNGFWRFKGQQQFYELSDFGTLNATINRQFLKKKLTITASYNDFLFTNNNHFEYHQGTQNATGYRESDSRRVGISLRYNFGIKPKENKMDMLDQGSNERN
jgi:iron complex outermembrane recepter protein